MPKALIKDPTATYKLPDPQDIRVEIGERLRKLRKLHKMSQKELAENLGKTSAAYIAFLESGERNMTAAELVRIAKHFRVSLSFFA